MLNKHNARSKGHTLTANLRKYLGVRSICMCIHICTACVTACTQTHRHPLLHQAIFFLLTLWLGYMYYFTQEVGIYTSSLTSSHTFSSCHCAYVCILQTEVGIIMKVICIAPYPCSMGKLKALYKKENFF